MKGALDARVEVYCVKAAFPVFAVYPFAVRQVTAAALQNMSSDDEEIALPSKAQLQQLKAQRSVASTSAASEVAAAVQAQTAAAAASGKNASDASTSATDSVATAGSISLPDDTDPTDPQLVAQEIAAWKERHLRRLVMMEK